LGVDSSIARLLLGARDLGASYRSTLTIGRQRFYLTQHELALELQRSGISNAERLAGELLQAASGYTEPFFQVLGAEQTDSLDFSDYEGATLVHDLNQPIPGDWSGRYTAVVDSGSLEHVFDFATAIRNCKRLVAPGGHFIGAYPANNQLGHGFYQFSPELFFRVFEEAAGFHVVRLYLVERGFRGRWYRVTDPKVLGRRSQIANRVRTELCVIAGRTGDLRLHIPQQSDYQVTWNRRDDSSPRSPRLPAWFQPFYLELAVRWNTRIWRAATRVNAIEDMRADT
jgi:SAM-dependent methyltransferase